MTLETPSRMMFMFTLLFVTTNKEVLADRVQLVEAYVLIMAALTAVRTIKNILLYDISLKRKEYGIIKVFRSSQQ